MSNARYCGDRIFVHGLTAECVIGFIDWERRVRQTVVIDLELAADARRAAATDEVSDTLDYRKVVRRVLAVVEASECHLIETLAERVARTVLDEFGIEWVRISLSKPGAFRHSRDVGITLERWHSEQPGGADAAARSGP
jgi:7,8-dihydroneopterin aldolase/epimerase/oxygenase